MTVANRFDFLAVLFAFFLSAVTKLCRKQECFCNCILHSSVQFRLGSSHDMGCCLMNTCGSDVNITNCTWDNVWVRQKIGVPEEHWLLDQIKT